MRVSYEWLKELVDLPWSPEETADKLAELGFPVQSMERTGVAVDNVISVKILSVAKHPNADRLQIADVTDGKEKRSIVCGAPNIAPHQVVPLALPGAKLPNGIEITVSKIRGVESAGMLCSERELGLSEEHAGILQFDRATPLGKSVKDIFGSNTILDVEITPNRPDLMSHIGIARELSAMANKPLKLPKTAAAKKGKGTCVIKIHEPKLCTRYMGKIIHGVKVGPSPDWMVKRLKAGGIRSINNIVDVTNYVLLEFGHPLHAFDLSKLAGGEIHVRLAHKGEKLAALDEKTYALEASDLIIADKENPVAIAGVMGGQPTGVTNATTDILLESAVFDRSTVRLTSRRLALRSESSIRFEKGTDETTAERASARAFDLIQQLAGGTPGASADAYPKKAAKRTVTLTEARLNAVVGTPIDKKTVAAILTRMDFAPKAGKGGWTCTIPSYRNDVSEDVDLIEEIVRVVGYNKIPSQVSNIKIGNLDKRFQVLDDTPWIDALRGLGLNETITHSFIEPGAASRFGYDPAKFLTLTNPLSQEESILRPSLLIGLVAAVGRNVNHQRSTVQLFECGKSFQIINGHVSEEKKLAFVSAGALKKKSWDQPGRNVDAYALKGYLETLSDALKLGFALKEGTKAPYLHPYQSFEIIQRGSAVGVAGMIHPALAQELDLVVPVAMAEIDYNALHARQKTASRPLPKYPFVERDIAILLDKTRKWGEVRQQVERAGGSLVVDSWPFDVFTGGNLAPTQKSLAFRVRLQHPDHTLSESEINGAVEKIKASLQENCGAQLR